MTAEPESLKIVEEPERDELEALLPELEDLKLSSGLVIKLKPLKARQFFRLLRIVTRGGAQILNQLRWTQLDSSDQFAAQFVAVIVFAIPEAEQETLDFIQSMIELPEDENERFLLLRELDDPELEDTINIIEQIILREKDDLASLGKKMRKWLDLAQKTGQVPKSQEQSRSSEDGQEPSTSSHQSTAGTTTKSSTSRSRASGKSR